LKKTFLHKICFQKKIIVPRLISRKFEDRRGKNNLFESAKLILQKFLRPFSPERAERDQIVTRKFCRKIKRIFFVALSRILLSRNFSKEKHSNPNVVENLSNQKFIIKCELKQTTPLFKNSREQALVRKKSFFISNQS